ncbi:MAG TPA: acylphosphatase [Gaiellaceae bacterium]|jgi:acylphosphatase
MIRRHVVLHGRVQGVGFRFSLLERARARGVAGWVRNRGDGTVEGVFEGDGDVVDALVEWCHRGPRGATVTDVDVRDERPEGLRSFDVR